jgi:cytochrome c oxidase cbb3-type subunit 4
MDTGTLQGIGTILAMAAFVGVCVWAWSSKNKADFDEAAQLPFADETKPKQEPKQEPEDELEKDQPTDNQPQTESEQIVKRGTGHE